MQRNPSMNDKPELNSQINPDDFKAHYWLKEELIAFSKMLKISSQGSKEKVTSRLYEYLVNGVIAPEKPNKAKPFSKNRKEESKGISLEDIISENYKNDQKHRAFFKSVIGSHFKFNVAFSTVGVYAIVVIAIVLITLSDGLIEFA